MSLFTSPAQEPNLGARDGGVVLVREDSHGDAPLVEREHGPAQAHVGEGKHTQVQSAGRRQDVSEEAGERGLDTVRQRAHAGAGGGEEKRKQEMSLPLYHLVVGCYPTGKGRLWPGGHVWLPWPFHPATRT